jgi:hypothetical protein
VGHLRCDRNAEGVHHLAGGPAHRSRPRRSILLYEDALHDRVRNVSSGVPRGEEQSVFHRWAGTRCREHQSNRWAEAHGGSAWRKRMAQAHGASVASPAPGAASTFIGSAVSASRRTLGAPRAHAAREPASTLQHLHSRSLPIGSLHYPVTTATMAIAIRATPSPTPTRAATRERPEPLRISTSRPEAIATNPNATEASGKRTRSVKTPAIPAKSENR